MARTILEKGNGTVETYETVAVAGAEDATGVNAAPVIIRGGANFTPSSYDADLTMDGTAQAVALATGTLKIKVVNRGVTTEAIRVVFGTSQSSAEDNLTIVAGAATTGDYLPSSVDQGDGEEVYGVPANATYYAVANSVSSDVQVVSISQGV